MRLNLSAEIMWQEHKMDLLSCFLCHPEAPSVPNLCIFTGFSFFVIVYLSLSSSQFFHGIGVERNGKQPTYIYPAEVKTLLRSVFSQNVCDYADPCHDKVSCGQCLHPATTLQHQPVVNGNCSDGYLDK